MELVVFVASALDAAGEVRGAELEEIASCLEPMSSFQRLPAISVTRPRTTSPVSGTYRACAAAEALSLFTRSTVPHTVARRRPFTTCVP